MAYFDGVQVGDKVWSFTYGWGEVTYLEEGYRKPIHVSFGERSALSFSMDGLWDSNESQTLFWDEIKFEVPKKPKKLVKKVVKRYINVYNDFEGHPFPSREEADGMADMRSSRLEYINRVACVELTGEYEVYE